MKTVSIVVICLVNLEIGFIIGSVVYEFSGPNVKNMAAIMQPSPISAPESIEYQAALQPAALGNFTQLDDWVSKLAEEGKFGVLPAMPAAFDRPDVIRVNHKAILVKNDSK